MLSLVNKVYNMSATTYTSLKSLFAKSSCDAVEKGSSLPVPNIIHLIYRVSVPGSGLLKALAVSIYHFQSLFWHIIALQNEEILIKNIAAGIIALSMALWPAVNVFERTVKGSPNLMGN